MSIAMMPTVKYNFLAIETFLSQFIIDNLFILVAISNNEVHYNEQLDIVI